MSRTTRGTVSALAAGLMLSLVLAGCGSPATNTGQTTGTAGPSTTATTNPAAGSDDYGYGAGPSTTSTTAAAKPGGAGPATASLVVKTAKTALGEILVDGNGMTLYLFTTDTATTSACNAGCAAAWPPLVGTAEAAGGLDKTAFATLTRQDGSKQATYEGHALYRFASDEKAGDLSGQGVGGNWFVIGVDGKAIEKPKP